MGMGGGRSSPARKRREEEVGPPAQKGRGTVGAWPCLPLPELYGLRARLEKRAPVWAYKRKFSGGWDGVSRFGRPRVAATTSTPNRARPSQSGLRFMGATMRLTPFNIEIEPATQLTVRRLQNNPSAPRHHLLRANAHLAQAMKVSGRSGGKRKAV